MHDNGPPPPALVDLLLLFFESDPKLKGKFWISGLPQLKAIRCGMGHALVIVDECSLIFSRLLHINASDPRLFDLVREAVDGHEVCLFYAGSTGGKYHDVDTTSNYNILRD